MLCPECKNGKTDICIGIALDLETDTFVECGTTIQAIFDKEENIA